MATDPDSDSGHTDWSTADLESGRYALSPGSGPNRGRVSTLSYRACPFSSMVEQRTFNPLVQGSSP